MLLTLDATDPRPRTQQIVRRIEALIEAGHLAAGQRLPSTRRLAEQLGLHRATVAMAYQTLWSLGWLELRAGALPRVRARVALAPAKAEPGGFDWTGLLRGGAPRPAPLAAAEAGQISFEPLGVDPRLMPVEAFGRSLKTALNRHGASILDYGDSQGFLPLRQSVARRLGQHGIQVEADEILITHGAQQALDLALRGLTRPGDSVAVEAPTYNQMLNLLEINGLRALPTSAQFDPEALEDLLKAERPALLYTMPSFQNPTGRSLPQKDREALLALCERHRVPILEDGFEEEMTYFGRPMLPIKSMDRSGLVLYVGTFSKILFPGLRIGWMAAARPVIQTLTALRRASELCPAPLLQAAMEDFLEKGHYDQHLARLHRQFRRRMDVALKSLRRELDPAQVKWEAPAGGYLIWLELVTEANKTNLDAHFSTYGLKVLQGDRFYRGTAPGAFIRLSISSLDENQIETGIHRLG